MWIYRGAFQIVYVLSALDKKVARLENLMLLLRFYTTQRSSVFYDLQFALTFPCNIELVSLSFIIQNEFYSVKTEWATAVKGKKKNISDKIEGRIAKITKSVRNNIDRLDAGYVKNFDLWITCTIEALNAQYVRVHIIFRHLIWANKSLQPINYNRSETIANIRDVRWKRWQEKTQQNLKLLPRNTRRHHTIPIYFPPTRKYMWMEFLTHIIHSVSKYVSEALFCLLGARMCCDEMLTA